MKYRVDFSYFIHGEENTVGFRNNFVFLYGDLPIGNADNLTRGEWIQIEKFALKKVNKFKCAQGKKIDILSAGMEIKKAKNK